MADPAPLSTPAPWNSVADGYSETTMRLFSSYIDRALDLLDVRAEEHVADIACGPGTLALAAAARGATVAALDFAPGMIRVLNATLAEQGLTGVTATEGDGQNLPYAAAGFDAAFSMFGLMFFPDRARGHAELFRILKPGGRVCVASWAPVDQSSLMTALFAGLKAMKPDLPAPDPDMASLENPDVLRAELQGAGFADVTVHRISDTATLASAEALWSDMEKGAVPVRMMREALGEATWTARRPQALAALDRTAGPFPASLSMTAWIGTGRKPG
ncbi:class I SAM-dependent methyltransferase [Ovoidimarina sediminis]|uniref:class I SAM-dependent methyltransferase n=1 Tax=Ovoidimarina sediminis TaxID=3079856 RepID=UPI00290A62BE|nr:methyltransferase domain-containing protein [Rhodophyticola sp. MJ-SS7]MDU8942810.1 methyltransferase domain-containing protein [Rhodophyticola sp. MJ-SS7]